MRKTATDATSGFLLGLDDDVSNPTDTIVFILRDPRTIRRGHIPRPEDVPATRRRVRACVQTIFDMTFLRTDTRRRIVSPRRRLMGSVCARPRRRWPQSHLHAYKYARTWWQFRYKRRSVDRSGRPSRERERDERSNEYSDK